MQFRLANLRDRMLATIFPGFFPSAKHNHYADFGYPDQVTFGLAWAMYCRNGLARAGVDKTVAKTWQDAPFIQEFAREGDKQGAPETAVEKDIRVRFGDLRVWQHLAEVDRRSLVGSYAGLILRLGDGKQFADPVDRVGGGLRGLVEVVPAWEGQLTVSEWDTDERSPSYGQPKMFQFSEAAVDAGRKNQGRQFLVHPDRVIVWSRDGTLHGRSTVEPGYNDLLTLEKIIGAGGEGFWKNAKSAPIIEIDKEARLDEMARSMGVAVDEIADKMDEQVRDFQKGFDQLLMLQGMKANTLNVALPSPEHFFGIALQSYAASISVPLKILVGSQTGERASTEDAQEWARTIMSRRVGETIPNLRLLLDRLERFGILPERDWHLDWKDLLDPSPNEMLERVERMATVNDKMRQSGELVFTAEEMRSEYGREPLSDAEKYVDREDEEDEAAALGMDQAA